MLASFTSVMPKCWTAACASCPSPGWSTRRGCSSSSSAACSVRVIDPDAREQVGIVCDRRLGGRAVRLVVLGAHPRPAGASGLCQEVGRVLSSSVRVARERCAQRSFGDRLGRACRAGRPRSALAPAPVDQVLLGVNLDTPTVVGHVARKRDAQRRGLGDRSAGDSDDVLRTRRRRRDDRASCWSWCVSLTMFRKRIGFADAGPAKANTDGL